MSKTPAHETISKMLSGPRWAILKAMEGMSTAQDIAARVGQTYNNVTHHLKALVELGVVRAYTKGGRVHYQRQTVFAELLIDFDDNDGPLVTDLSFEVTKTKKPTGYQEVVG